MSLGIAERPSCQSHLTSSTAEHLISVELASAELVVALEEVAIDDLDADGVARYVRSARLLQRHLEAAVVRAGIRADRLAEDGRGASARDACLGSGEVRGSTARREAKRVALAARRSDLAVAMSSGRFGPDHLDALVRRLAHLPADQLGSIDLASLLDDADQLPADTFDVALRRHVDRATASVAGGEDPDQTDHGHESGGGTDEGPQPSAAERAAEAAWAASEVRHWFDHRTGLGHLHATIDPERYEALVTAIDQHTAALANRAASDGQHQAKNAHLAAAALVDLACSAGARARHLPHVTVVVDAKTLARGRHVDSTAETGDGHGLTDQALARLCCDATLQRVTHDDRGIPVDVGRRYRTATSAQWAALRSMYASCGWTGCDAPLSHCQAHHLKPWSDGGRTDLGNLIPLCSHHHHQVHEGRWRLQLDPVDRSITLIRPDGAEHSRSPHPPMRREPPLELSILDN